MDLGIEGRRAAVAASTAGLGFATAQALAEAGCRVVISGRDPERLARAAARLPGSIPLQADVSTAAGATKFVEDSERALGAIDILIVNAGGPPNGTFASTPLDAYQVALDLNLISVVAMCKATVPAMQARKWGRVVAITSVAVKQPIPNLILSNTARAGATGFLKTLALEVAADRVTVNSVLPGFHATDRVTQRHGVDVRSLEEATAAGTAGDPADFGRVVAFLCSESARFVTGVALPVDGGAYKGTL